MNFWKKLFATEGSPGASITEMETTQPFSIHDAAEIGEFPKVMALLKTNSNLVSSTDGNGMTPLHKAALKGHKKVAELLLSCNAEVNARDNNAWTPLHEAAFEGHKDVAKLLLHRKAEVNARNNDGFTPLHWAAEKGHKGAVKLLIANKGEVNAKDNNGMTPLHKAALKGHKDVAQLLLSGNAKVNAKDNNGWTPLHEAALEGHRDVAELLLARHADVNARNKGGSTPLHYATSKGHHALAEFLLARNASRCAEMHKWVDYGMNLKKCEVCGFVQKPEAGVFRYPDDGWPYGWLTVRFHRCPICYGEGASPKLGIPGKGDHTMEFHFPEATYESLISGDGTFEQCPFCGCAIRLRLKTSMEYLRSDGKSGPCPSAHLRYAHHDGSVSHLDLATCPSCGSAFSFSNGLCFKCRYYDIKSDDFEWMVR